MTVDCPLTCYICGKTRDEWVTIDLIGCFEDQEMAEKRFREKFGRNPDSYLFVCRNCYKKNKAYAKNVEKKYGIFQ